MPSLPFQPPGGPKAWRHHHDVPGLDQPVAAPRWCREHEFCVTLEDYLRRRTNIAQWLPREGLGRNGENRDVLLAAARELYGADQTVAEEAVARYEETVAVRFDKLLNEAF